MSSNLLDPDRLRERARALLGPHADTLTISVIDRAHWTLEPDASSWDSSHGLVRAHRVVLVLPSTVVDAIAARPSVHDALVAVVARAFAETEGHALADLAIERSADRASTERGPYR